VNGLTHRLGASLRRAPYVWLVATILLMLQLDSTLRVAVDEPRSHNPWIAVEAIGFAIYSVVLWFSYRAISRVTRESPTWRSASHSRGGRSRVRRTSSATSGRRGCEPVGVALGSVTTIALLVASARRTRREASVAPST